VNLKQLEAFREVMSGGSVSAAAARLHLSQPSVSRLLSELEKLAGLKLFDHRRGKLTPRPEAFTFALEVDRALYGLNHLRRAADEIRTSGGLRLRVVSFPVLGHGLLPEIIAAFTEQYPDVRLSVSVRSSHYVLEALTSGAADIGILGTVVARPGLRLEKRFTADCVCVLPPEHPLAGTEAIEVAKLSRETFVWLDPTSQIEPALRRAIGDPPGSRGRLEVNLGITAYQLVQRRVGIAVLDPLTAACNLGEELVIRPLSPPIAFEFSVMRAASARSEAAETFLAMLLDRCERALELRQRAVPRVPDFPTAVY
jgi:DNA-binding transcriptional LysR family regulator